MSYQQFEIWQIARSLVIDIHKMTLTELPKFEMYEEGAQIRRSIKSVKANIVGVTVDDAIGRTTSVSWLSHMRRATRRKTTWKHSAKLILSRTTGCI